uniref:Uncharacterized protein n=2 Tax=Opuntia streptacantha TaxID=393608 RepID=A0A7C9ABQ7_OPUST
MDMSSDKVQFLKKAYDGLQQPLSQFLETTSPVVDWIIYDFSSHWLPPIAEKLGIRKVFFFITNACTCSVFGPISHLLADCDTWTKPEDLTKQPKWVPFPTPIVYRLYEAQQILYATKKNASGVSDVFRTGVAISGCDVMALRSCMELEAEYLQLLEKLYGKPVLPIGLLPVSIEDEGERGNNDTWQSAIGWLNKQRNGSVVYVALGSEVALSQDQINELAHGLELSRVPFLWAWRKPEGSSVELPDGFEERTKGNGLVFKKWAPQPRILSHDSVAAFLTHGGWSSVIEGLQFGKPLVVLSLTWDLNTRILAAKKVGIEIPRNEEDGSFTRSSVAESLKELFQDETAKIYKEEAQKISEIFGNESLHSQYIDKFEQYLSQSMKQIR